MAEAEENKKQLSLETCKVLTGTVVSDKMNKTLVVKVDAVPGTPSTIKW